MLLFFDLCNTINVFFFGFGFFGNETLNMRACLGGRLLVVFIVIVFVFIFLYKLFFIYISEKL